jgi:thiosulfate/3-mercaptopyruvate sulfurtransferase
MTTQACWLLLTLAATGGDTAKDYPQRHLLVEAKDLAKPETAKGFHIVDARPAAKYEKGHIPGASWVDHEEWSKAFGKSQDPKEWAKRISAAGIRNTDKIVIYDDVMQKDAARIWWILRYFGHKDARLLNGGIQAWSDAGQPLSKEPFRTTVSMYTIETPDAARLATREDVLKLLKGTSIQIIDARSEKEYCGDDKLKNKKGGAIPGAMNLEWTEALDKKTQRFKSADELTEIFKRAGIDVTRPTVTHCQSGGRAAVMAFTLELMGAKGVANYYRGWSEWGNSEDTPIVTPKKSK